MEDDPTTSGAAEDGVEIFVGDRDAAVAAVRAPSGWRLSALVACGALAIGLGWRLS